LAVVLAFSATAQNAPEPKKAPEGPPPQITNQDNKTDKGQRSPGGSAPGIPQSQPAREEQTTANGNRENGAEQQDDTDSRLARFTKLLVIVGALQFVALIAQAFFLNKSIRLTRDSIILSQRPRLIVRNVVARQPDCITIPGTPPFGKGKPVGGQFFVANVGGSEATVRESRYIVIGLEGTLPMERPYEGQAGNNPITVKCVLPPGGVTPGLISAPNPFPDKDPMPTPTAGDRGEHTSVYVMGWIEYSDGLGSVRRTAFCRKYHWRRKRFFAVKDPDYEHAE
jgi:hypothetical protein